MGWTEFCTDYKIPYRMTSSGRNLEINCPLCLNDKKSHMGLRTDVLTWGCFKGGKAHGSKKSAVRLIMALLNCPFEVALNISRHYFEWTQSSNLNPEMFEKAGGLSPCVVPQNFLQFTTYVDDKIMQIQNQHLQYLQQRGLDPNFVCPRFDLRWGYKGRYNNRIIVPVKLDQNHWLTWAARDIGTSSLRYKNAEYPKEAKHAPSDFFFDIHNLTGGRTLILTEGPFDAMKIVQAMVPDVHGSAIFRLGMTDGQLAILSDLSELYESIYLCYDGNLHLKTLRDAAKAAWHVPNLKPLLIPFKDFGSISIEETRQFVVETTQGK